MIQEEEIKQSDVQMNNLVSPNIRKEDKFDNYYVKIND